MTVKVDTYGLTVQAARPGIVQNIAIGAGSLQSLAFTVGSIGEYAMDGTPTRPQTTQHVRLCATSDCWVMFGPNPTASATVGMLLPAMTPEYFWVLPGEKLAVLQASAAGSLNIIECATL
jgi:hypothetical protein